MGYCEKTILRGHLKGFLNLGPGQLQPRKRQSTKLRAGNPKEDVLLFLAQAVTTHSCDTCDTSHGLYHSLQPEDDQSGPDL